MVLHKHWSLGNPNSHVETEKGLKKPNRPQKTLRVQLIPCKRTLKPLRRLKNFKTGKISDFITSVLQRNLKLLHIWQHFRFLHIFHVQKFWILDMYRNLKFLLMTNFLHISH